MSLEFKNQLKALLNNPNLDFSELKKRFWVNLKPSSKNKPPTKSAVMVLVFPHDGQISTVLLRRVSDGSAHSGQISLPGGHFEPSDNDLKTTALRETYEEIGVPPQKIEILGKLSQVYVVVSNFTIQPFVGWIPGPPQISLNHDEIDEFYFVPLKTFTDPGKIISKTFIIQGKPTQTYGFVHNSIYIWGATARIFAELGGYLSALEKMNIRF